MTGIITVESVIVQTAEEHSAGLPEPLLRSQTFDVYLAYASYSENCDFLFRKV